MAAPNMISFNFMTGNTAFQNVTTVATAIVSNPAASGKVLKVNSLIVSNYQGSNPADITVDIVRSSISYTLASTITIPADASLVVISRENAIYLEEGDAMRCLASANSYLNAVCSFENIG